MKYLKLFEDFNDYDPYELMIMSPNKKGEMIMDEIKKKDKANLNLVNDLIVLGANLDWQDEDGLTALHRCVFWNHPDIARMLIDAGADVNFQRNDGESALHECAYWNRPKIARVLIDAGADLNLRESYYGLTTLHMCAWKNHPEIARMLLDAGADKTISDNEGRLPYELAQTQELKKLLQP